MSGLYVHIPFCRKKCGYCNFFSVATLRSREALISSLLQEIAWQGGSWPFNPIQTLYFGGGTPSLLEDNHLATLIEAIHVSFHIANQAEITLECNPDDINTSKLNSWKTMGINRLSIGIQSFHPADLSYLDRLHDAQQAFSCIDRSRKAGYDNISIDLIYGIPGQSMQAWEANLSRAVDLSLPHISAYALTIEDNTILKTLIEKGVKAIPVEDRASEHFLYMHSRLTEAGYHHYEISNFARDHAYAIHNTSYWKGIPYLGLGPSAHSFNGKKRWWNVSKLTPYIHANTLADMQEASEVLSLEERYNEFIMTGLRTMWGCKPALIESLFSLASRQDFETRALQYAREGLMHHHEDAWILTPAGMLLADSLAASFFMDVMPSGLSNES